MVVTFADTERETAWRQEVRTFIDDEVPREPRTGAGQLPASFVRTQEVRR